MSTDVLAGPKARSPADRLKLLGWPVERRTGCLAMVTIACAYTVVFGLSSSHPMPRYHGG